MTRVVVADGDGSVRSQVRLTLGDDRYEVAEAEDTTAAVLAIARHRPDLVVVDAGLPGEGGRAVARSLKQQPETRHARVLLLVDRGGQVEADDADEGIDAVLAKPFNAFTLLRKVDALLTDG